MKIEDKKLNLSEAADRAPAAAEIILGSGDRIHVAAVMLYEQAAVEETLDLRVRAYALLEVDPAVLPALEEWAVTPAALVSALNRGVPARKAEQAEALLRDAERLAAEARRDGRFFPVGDIDGIEQPYPHLWSHAESVVLQHRARGLFGGRAIDEQAERRWVHGGEAFVGIKDEGGLRRALRWSDVEQYRLVPAGEAG